MSLSEQDYVPQFFWSPRAEPFLVETRFLGDLSNCGESSQIEIPLVPGDSKHEDDVNLGQDIGEDHSPLAPCKENLEPVLSLDYDVRNRETRPDNRARFLLPLHK